MTYRLGVKQHGARHRLIGFLFLAGFLIAFVGGQGFARESSLVYVQFNGYGFACIEYEDVAALVGPGPLEVRNLALMLRETPVPIRILGGEDGTLDPGDAILFFSEESAWRYTNTCVYSLCVHSDRGAFLDSPQPWSPDLKLVVVNDAEKMYTHMYSHAFARSRTAELKLPCDYTPFQKLGIEIVPDPPCSPAASFLVRTPKRERTVTAMPDGTIDFEYSLKEDGTIGRNIWFSSLLDEDTVSYRVYLKEHRERDNQFALYLDMQQDEGLMLMPGFQEAEHFVWHVEEKRLLPSAMMDFDAKRMLGFPLKKGKSQVFIATRKGALRPARVFRDELVPEETIEAEYLAIAPRKFLKALKDHLEFRKRDLGSASCVSLERIYSLYSHNDPDPVAIRSFIENRTSHVKYILLVGAARERVNAGYGRPYSVPCEHFDTFDLLPPLPYMFKNIFVPCDTPFGDRDLDGCPEIAVGRIPCATPEELKSVLKKIRKYESEPVGADWGNRLFLQAGTGRYDAYGGDQEAQKLMTRALETLVEELAHTWIPSGYSLDVLYGNPESPYFFPPAKLRDRAVTELDRGFAAAFYAGPGLVRRYGNFSWRKELYESFFAEDAGRIAIESGMGPYFALTGSAGTFTERKGMRCVAEELIMNPQGPSAVIAASRDVDDVANILFSFALLKHFFHDKVPRIGDLLNATKKTMPELLDSAELNDLLTTIRGRSIIRISEKERVLLGQFQFDLFGDPAMKLRYPAGRIELSAPPSIPSGSVLAVEGHITGTPDGMVRVELEIPRHRMNETVLPPSEELPREEAEALIIANYFKANRRMFLSRDCPFKEGAFRIELPLPQDVKPGAILIKAHTFGGQAPAMGELKTEIR